MKKQVDVIFLKGDGPISELIELITHGKYSHSAIKILGGVIEALGTPDGEAYAGVWLHDIAKYDTIKEKSVVTVEVPNIEEAKWKAFDLIGTHYGYEDCISGAIYDEFKKQIDTPQEKGMDCSEAVATILRAGGLNILPDVDADCITPNDLYKALAKIAVKIS